MTSSPAQTRLSLLARAERPVRFEGGQGRLQPGEPDDGVQHQVGLDLPHQAGRPPAPVLILASG